MAPNIHLLLGAEHRLFKLQVQVFAQIRVRAARGCAAVRPAAEHIAEAEKLAKNVAEILEDRGIESRRARRRLPPTPACPKRS